MIEDVKKIQKELVHPRDVVILSHRNPDGDALGSSLAMRAYLVEKGHFVKCIFPSEYPENFEWMPGIKDSIIYDISPEEAIKSIEKAHLILCLDFNALDRIDKMGEAVDLNKNAFKVLIDHHLDPEPFADYYYCDNQASSTCELVYRMLDDMGEIHSVKGNIADFLYTGIVTDTGSFHHATNANLFRIIANLKDKGLDDSNLQNLIFNNQSEKQMRLLGHCLANRMNINEEHGIGLIYLTKDDYAEFDIQRGDTEGIINYLLKVNSVKLAAFITQQPRIIKLSLRSKGNISVQALAREHFNGGGHFNASGGYAHSSLAHVIKKFWEVTPLYTK